MSKGKIRVRVEGADTINIEALRVLQGDLKTLSKDNYEKLRMSILKFGIISPFHVWKGDSNWILDGTQRYHTILSMIKEGFDCPKLPVVWIEAENEAEARRQLLSLVSQYGELQEQGLYEYMHISEISIGELKETFHNPEIKMDMFEASYEGGQYSPGDESDQQSLDEKKKVTCPECDFEFTP